MAKLVMKVQGVDGAVELLSDRVIITHPGIWNALKFGLNASREIPLGAIAEIGFKNANMLMWGEIDFIVGGGRPVQQMGKKKKASPTAVAFKKDKQRQFEMLKEKVFELMATQNAQRKA
jgi:hypothetical protein